jgi:hypothetical protein
MAGKMKMICSYKLFYLKFNQLKVNTKFLSPLIAAYDDRLAERDDKNKQLRV